ncbi:MAG: hypothetical protein ACOX1O_07595 [Eggerthellaceae bacterium]
MTNEQETDQNLAPQNKIDSQPDQADTPLDSAFPEKPETSDLAERLRAAEEQALIRTYAKLRLHDEAFTLSGELGLPLLSKDEVVLSFELASDSNNDSDEVLMEVPVTKTAPTSENMTLSWSVTIEWARLVRTSPLSVGDRFYGHLIVEHLGKRQSIDVLLDPFASDAVILFIDILERSQAFMAGIEAGQALLTVSTFEHDADMSLQYSVESLEWQGDCFTGSLLLEHPLVNANAMELIMGLELENAGQDFGPLPISVGSYYVDSTIKRCTFSFKPEQLIPASVDAAARLRYNLVLAYHLLGNSMGKRIDLFASSAEVDTVSVEEHQIISQNRFIKPCTTSDRPIAFEVETVAHALSDSTEVRTLDLSWNDGVLNMTGTINQRLLELSGFDLMMVLYNSEGQQRPVPWKTADEPLEERAFGRAWSSSFKASAVLAGLKPGTWHFGFAKHYGPLSAVEPFTLNLHDGLIDQFVKKIIRTGNDYWIPETESNGAIGFKTVDASSIAESATPRISHIEWVGDEKLSVSGTARHPLTHIGGLECSLMLQSVSDDSIEIPLRTTISDDGTISWRGDFNPISLLSEKNPSLWYLTFAKRFDTSFDSEILVNNAGEDETQRMLGHPLPSNCKVMEGVGGSIGFRTSKKLEEAPASTEKQERRRFRFFRR